VQIGLLGNARLFRKRRARATPVHDEVNPLYRPEWIPYRVTGDIAVSINFRPVSVSAATTKNDMRVFREYRDRSHAYARVSPR